MSVAVVLIACAAAVIAIERESSYYEASPPVKPETHARLQESQEVLILNQYIDETLTKMRTDKHIKEVLDPFLLDRDVNTKNARLHDLKVSGLLSLHRVGDVMVSPDEGVVTAALAIDNLGVFFQYDLNTVASVVLRGRFDGTVERLSARLKIKLSEATSELLEFNVLELGKIKVKRFTGTSAAFNWLVKRILQSSMNHNRERIRIKVQAVLREKLTDELRKVSLEKIISDMIA